MKTQMMLLAFVLAIVNGNPTKQTASNIITSSSESSESETKQNEETTPNNSAPEQKKETNELGATIADDDTTKYTNGNVDIIIESYNQEDFVTEPDVTYEPITEPPMADNLNIYRNALANKVQDEIMEMAAGFVPIPIFRNRQKARRRFANRRHFARNPYRQPFYYYNPYYRFYRPSSLRFY